MDTPGITGEHLAHFERNGFFLIPNPRPLPPQCQAAEFFPGGFRASGRPA